VSDVIPASIKDQRTRLEMNLSAADATLRDALHRITDDQLDEEIDGVRLALAESDFGAGATPRAARLYRLALASMQRERALRRLRALDN